MQDNLLIHLQPSQGYNQVLKIGQYNMQLTNFAVLQLAKGSSWQGSSGEFEVALVLLGGKCAIKGPGFEFTEIGGRENVFAGKPHTLYLPWHTDYQISALTDVDIAITEAPASRDTAPATLITPEMTRSFSVGRDNFTRQATVMIDEKFPSEHFYIGEGMIPSGNWSGYPPHRHDIDNLPDEVDMEETYFYRFDPAQGFGIQKVYTPDGRIDVTYTVKNNDTVAIAEGYHPLCGAPGYNMYYLWSMCGKVNRGLISSLDPEHSWVVKKA